MTDDPSTAGTEMPLRLLSLETSGQAGSVAAFENGQLVCERPLEAGQRSAKSLAPGIRDLLNALNWRPADVRVVAVTTGPGSFTGLRVGVTTAKTFAYAVGADVIGVNTLAAIVHQAPPVSERIWAVMDAQRGDVYAGLFSIAASDIWEPAGPTAIMPRDAWLEAVRPGEAATGPALGGLLDRLPHGVAPVAEAAWLPSAGAVGRVATRNYAQGQRETVWELSPHYFRRSAAEEKLDRDTVG